MVNKNPDRGRTGVEDRSRTLFEASVAGLNASIRSRLTQARHAAVAGFEQQRGSRFFATAFRNWKFREWAPATAVAAAALIVTIVLLTDTTTREPLRDAALTADDMTLLLNGDNLDLIEEMEFYAWLDGAVTDSDAADDNSGSNKSGGFDEIEDASQTDANRS